MKKFLFLSLFCAGFILANAQLSDGSYAPDFTVYEIDKSNGTILSNNPYTLYQYTDSGKTVYLDFFATWCGPCWNYHQTGAFETLYSQYGPNGTNEVMAFAIEGSYGNYASLANTGADNAGYSSQGNWLNGVLYPVIPTTMSPNTQAVVNSYSISYFPTVYMVCPNRLVYEIGQQDAATLYAAKSEVCSSYDASVETNAIIPRYSIDNEIGGIGDAYLCDMTATPKVLLQNVGSTAITSAEFAITLDGQTTTYSWTGNLAEKYSVVAVNLPQITSNTHGEHTYEVSLVSTNGVAVADATSKSRSYTFYVSSETTDEDIDEDFSDLEYPWFFDTPDYFVMYNGAVCFYAYSISSGKYGSLYAPIMDISRFQVPVLKFDVAHKRYNASNKERLQVQVSTNCGSTWTTLYNVVDPNLATSTAYATSVYIPSATDWRAEVVDLSSISNKDNVSMRFRFTSGYGNNVWIDNVRVVEGLGIEDHEAGILSVYPNPVADMLYVSSAEPVSEVQIFNLQGQLVLTQRGDIQAVSVTDLADGVYMLKATTQSGTVTTQKIIKQ